MIKWIFFFFGCACLINCHPCPQEDSHCDYVIVVHRENLEKGESETNNKIGEIVEVLTQKYVHFNPQVVSFEECRNKLAQIQPKYTVFLTKGGRAEVEFISNLCRNLDQDPYVDTFWGIIPTTDLDSSLQLVKGDNQLKIQKAIDCENILQSENFIQTYTFDENQREKLLIHDEKGNRIEKTAFDNTQKFLELMTLFKPHLLVTSAHASEKNWAMGYCGPNMMVYSKSGKLYARDTKNKEYEISEPSPKIWLAVGNCLMGNGIEKNQMVTAILKNCGVKQFVGYTVETWYGRMGWGMLGTFTPCMNSKGKDLTIYGTYPGYYNVTEAFHFNNDALLRELMSKKLSNQARKGHQYDLNTSVLYGDPAFDARVSQAQVSPFTVHQNWSEKGSLTITVTTQKSGKWPVCGVYIPLTQTWLGEQCDRNHFLCNERYVLFLPEKSEYQANEKYQVEFKFPPLSNNQK